MRFEWFDGTLLLLETTAVAKAFWRMALVVEVECVVDAAAAAADVLDGR